MGNEHAFVRRQWDWAGIGMRDNTAYLSGRVVVAPDRTEGDLYVYDPFMRELILSTYHLSLDTAPRFLEAMQARNVKAIIGYTSSIYFLAKASLDLGIRVKLAAALPTSETIAPSMRETIGEAFGCPVFDFYGAAERVCYIFTCEQGSYHVQPEYGYTEFLPCQDGDRRGRRIVATGFWIYGMPLIRYDTGDIVVPSDRVCSCGRAFETVESIQGRTGDKIRTPSGKEYAPTLLARVAKGARHVLQTQIVQDTLDHINILYVPGREFADADRCHFESHMRSHLPAELKMDFLEVPQIEKTGTGKANLVVSRLK